MNADDVWKTRGADNEREAIPDIPSLHSPRVPRVTLQGEISEVSLLTLLDVLPDPLVLVDSAGHIALVNSQAEALFGYPRSDLEGLQLEVLLPERFHTAKCSIVSAMPPLPASVPWVRGWSCTVDAKMARRFRWTSA